MFTSTTSNATKEDEKIENEIIKEEKIENTLDSIDSILEHERQKNKKDNWIKLDKTAKFIHLPKVTENNIACHQRI